MRKQITHSLFFLVLGLLVFSCHRDKIKSPENESTSSTKKLKEKYAGILGVPEKEIENIKLFNFIDEWYGTPYKYGGKTKAGVDCSNFATLLMKNVYAKTVSPPCTKLFDMSVALSKNDLKEGDLVFFKIDGNKISHVGVYLTNDKFVHASTKKGVVISSLNDDYYKKYYYKGGRIK